MSLYDYPHTNFYDRDQGVIIEKIQALETVYQNILITNEAIESSINTYVAAQFQTMIDNNEFGNIGDAFIDALF